MWDPWDPWESLGGGASGGTFDWGLISWQPRFFTDRCDLWQPDFPIPAGGDPGATTWTRRAVGLPAHFIRKSAVDQAMLIGLVESDDLMTVDEIHLPIWAKIIDSSWILIDRTIDVNGDPAGTYGKAYICRGEPAKVSATITPRQTAAKVIAFVSKLAVVPSGVTV